MAKKIEARVAISAQDATGATFDKIADSMKSIERTVKSFEAFKGRAFTGNLARDAWPSEFRASLLWPDQAVVDRLRLAARWLPRELPQPVDIDALMHGDR